MRISPVTAALAAVALAFSVIVAISAKSYDFRSFYCAGIAVREHANPYAEQPLHDCEQQTQRDPGFPVQRTNTTLPAPFPGYVLALFSLISRIPFSIASRLWTLALALATGVAVLALLKINKLSPTTVVAACILSLGAASVMLGEVVPLCVAAISLCAWWAQRGRWDAAGLAAAATLVEPHIGLPVVISVALWFPRARLALGLSVAALAAVSVGTLGTELNVQYVTQILPAHALSEIAGDAQLSFSVVAAAAGASPQVALALGSASYCAAAIGGIVLGGVMARRLETPAFAAAAPAAMAVVGGTFIHITQMAAAIPFVLLLLGRPVKHRVACLAALVLLSVPWRMISNPLWEAAAVIVAFVLVWENSGHSVAASSFAAALALAVLLALNSHGMPEIYRPLAAASAVHIDPRIAEARWAAYNTDYQSSGAPITWWQRMPSWLGLLILVAASAKMRRATA